MAPQPSSSPTRSAASRQAPGGGRIVAPLLAYAVVLIMVANTFLIANRAAHRNGLAPESANALGAGAALFVLVAFGGFAWLLTRRGNEAAPDKVKRSSRCHGADEPPR